MPRRFPSGAVSFRSATTGHRNQMPCHARRKLRGETFTIGCSAHPRKAASAVRQRRYPSVLVSLDRLSYYQRRRGRRHALLSPLAKPQAAAKRIYGHRIAAGLVEAQNAARIFRHLLRSRVYEPGEIVKGSSCGVRHAMVHAWGHGAAAIVSRCLFSIRCKVEEQVQESK